MATSNLLMPLSEGSLTGGQQFLIGFLCLLLVALMVLLFAFACSIYCEYGLALGLLTWFTGNAALYGIFQGSFKEIFQKANFSDEDAIYKSRTIT